MTNIWVGFRCRFEKKEGGGELDTVHHPVLVAANLLILLVFLS